MEACRHTKKFNSKLKIIVVSCWPLYASPEDGDAQWLYSLLSAWLLVLAILLLFTWLGFLPPLTGVTTNLSPSDDREAFEYCSDTQFMKRCTFFILFPYFCGSRLIRVQRFFWKSDASWKSNHQRQSVHVPVQCTDTVEFVHKIHQCLWFPICGQFERVVAGGVLTSWVILVLYSSIYLKLILINTNIFILHWNEFKWRINMSMTLHHLFEAVALILYTKRWRSVEAGGGV